MELISRTVLRVVHLTTPFVVAYLSLTACSEAAAEHRTITIQDVLRLDAISYSHSPPVLSSDGTLIAITICASRDSQDIETSDLPKGVQNCSLRVYDAVRSELSVEPEGFQTSWAPSWSPDGNKIAFLGKRDSEFGVFIWDLGSNSISQLNGADPAIPKLYERLQWLDDKRLLYRSVDSEGVQGSRRQENGVDSGGKAKVEIYMSPTVRAGQNQVPKERQSVLKCFDIEKSVASVLIKDFKAFRFSLSPDKKSLAAMIPSGDDSSTPSIFVSDLAIYDMPSGKLRATRGRIRSGGARSFSWSPDSQYLATRDVSVRVQESRSRFSTIAESTTLGANLLIVRASDAFTIKARASAENTFSDYVQAPLWSPAGDVLYAISGSEVWSIDANTGSTSLVKRLEGLRVKSIVQASSNTAFTPTGNNQFLYLAVASTDGVDEGFVQLELGNGRIISSYLWENAMRADFRLPIAASTGWIFFFSEQFDKPGTVYQMSVADGQRKRLVKINLHVDTIGFGERQIVTFAMASGELLPSLVMFPPGYEAGNRIPVVTIVYASGTPLRGINRFGVWSERSLNLHLLTAQGYGVLWPAIPVNVGSPRADILSAVLPAVDNLIASGIADPEKVSVIGQSNGGYTALTLLVHSDRFAAGVVMAGFGDLTAFYGAMNGTWIRWLEDRGGAMGVAPWDKPKRYMVNSPIYYLDDLNAPVLMQVGTNDYPIVQFMDQIWVGLNRLEKEVIYLKYQGEGHVMSGPENLSDFYRRLLSFLDRYSQTTE